MASHIEGKGAGVMEMANLHRKVEQFIFIVEYRKTWRYKRCVSASGEAHTLIGGDLLVTAGEKHFPF